MHQPLNLYNKPLSFSFYGRCLGIVVCGFLSVFFALVAMPIPNLTFVFYGFAVVLLWQCLPTISQIILWGYEYNKRKGVMIGISFSLIWIAISILSCTSCLLLFPNPYIHTCIIYFVYSVGVFVILWILAQCIMLSCNILTDEMVECIEIFWQKQDRCMEWKKLCTQKIEEYNLLNKNIRKQYANIAKNKDLYYIKYNRRIIVHFVTSILWISFPIYFFIYIPFQSYTNVEDFPHFYQLIFYCTIALIILQIIKYIGELFKKYYIHEYGIRIKKWNKTRFFYWYDMKHIHLHKEILYIFCWNEKIIKIHWREFDNFKEFWMYLTKKLPLCIFYIDYPAQIKLKEILGNQYKIFELRYKNSHCASVSVGQNNIKNKDQKNNKHQQKEDDEYILYNS